MSKKKTIFKKCNEENKTQDEEEKFDELDPHADKIDVEVNEFSTLISLPRSREVDNLCSLEDDQLHPVKKKFK